MQAGTRSQLQLAAVTARRQQELILYNIRRQIAAANSQKAARTYTCTFELLVGEPLLALTASKLQLAYL